MMLIKRWCIGTTLADNAGISNCRRGWIGNIKQRKLNALIKSTPTVTPASTISGNGIFTYSDQQVITDRVQVIRIAW